MQEGTRVLAVALSNEVFDKLDDFVKEAQVTKKQYVAELIEKDLEQKLQQKQEPAKQIEVRQAPDGQQIWGRVEVINALDKFMIENGRIPTQKEFKNENGLPSYNAAGRALEVSPAEYMKERFDEVMAEQQEEAG
ncbi:MAG: hypothetical protein IJE62_08610, partial [Clostridia bacterium]|nr:hypothetical protein [Clostridia bacterium]